jgi:uncharacterized protein (DUF1778 family)
MRCNHEGVQPMRSVHLRFSDHVYCLIEQEAEALEESVAQFSRTAIVARAALWAHRRGYSWADAEAWDPLIEAMDAIDEHDTQLRAELARKARHEKEARV